MLRSKGKFLRIWNRDYICLPCLRAGHKNRKDRIFWWSFKKKISKSLKERLYLLQGSASSLCTTRIEMIFNRRSKGKFLKIWKRNYIYYKVLCWCVAIRIERVFDDRSKGKFSRIWKRNYIYYKALCWCMATRIERIGFFDGCSKKKIPKSLKERLYLQQGSVSSPQESKWFLIIAWKKNS